jgi:diacylglycerol kinase family enzyme
LWFDKLRGTDGVHFWKAESIVCEPLDSNPVYAQIDGESLARLPVEFKIMPRALKLLVPRNGIAQKSRANG